MFQALTLAACLLVLAIHGLLGDPVRALAPVIAQLEPMLRHTAATLSEMGIESTPAELGAATARAAWATLGWMVLLHAFLAQCAGLWSFGRLREPGLFGREFRRLTLGRFIAWLLVAAFAVSFLAHRLADLGHIVLGCGRTASAIEALQRDLGEPHAFSIVDVAAADQVDTWARRLLARHPPVDLLLNNVGGGPPMTPWAEFRQLAPATLAEHMRGRLVLDPYRVLDGRAAAAAGLDWHTLGVS